jgi:iron complex transport system substrate-binding protein
VTEFCDYPPEAKTRTVVGGFSGATVSVERIVALKSDLVLVSGEMHGRIVSLLDAVGIRSFALEPKTFAEVYADILTVGRLTGCEDGAERVVASMRGRIDAVKAKAMGGSRPSVFWELWPDPLMSAGGPTFVSETIAAAGGRNIFADLGERWPLVSFEELLVRDPDWIILESAGGQRVSVASVAGRPLWSKLRAVKNGHIASVDADIIERGGPRLADAVETIARIFNTEPVR